MVKEQDFGMKIFDLGTQMAFTNENIQRVKSLKMFCAITSCACMLTLGFFLFSAFALNEFAVDYLWSFMGSLLVISMLLVSRYGYTQDKSREANLRKDLMQKQINMCSHLIFRTSIN